KAPTEVNAGRPLPDPGNLEKFRDPMALNKSFLFEVTGNPTGGMVWGTDVYTSDSSLAAAAVHAGVLRPDQKGLVKVTLLETKGSFDGSMRNGVQSYAWTSWPVGYRIEPTAVKK